ncbi:chemotaxis-specific protein-glutamate methyltransferase CheB [Sphingomonas bacterium]|uniref:chemotaxis-specific protein-glutamate methyltransferase CheB n=1 Tax=Sphingomonas bacterium TaxID=1895847 RepID=UPI0020C5C0BB|nr:chemotaxis-specific protein-glutamate methyltransferase CheB [Sphingomonas bacterium]
MPAARPGRPIRVLIVDDSIVARAVLARILAPDRGFDVAGQAGTAAAAIDILKTQAVDIILLDVNMPGLSGLDALPALIERSGGARVLIVSSDCGTGAAVTISALRLGAADTLLKPSAGALNGPFAVTLVETILRIAAAPRPSAPQGDILPVARQAPFVPVASQAGVDCVAIGASTGGVHALASFFAAYPFEALPPILVTQHLPAPFMPFFARQLSEMTGRPTRLATDGAPLTPGIVLLAPGDGHLGLARTRGRVHVKICRRPTSSGCMPSADTMLASVAEMFGDRGMGVILSGMGRDGLEGATRLTEAGGEVVAQDAMSSVVWGMPGAVAKAGIARAILPPAALADHVAAQAMRPERSAWK